jgi:integrase
MSESGLVDVTGPSAITGGDAWLLGGVRATEQGAALSGRSTDGRGDYPRDARSRARSIPDRTRGRIAILWRAGLRISEALALTETDLDAKTGSVLVRAGKGGKRRMVGMDDWGWEHVARWTEHGG